MIKSTEERFLNSITKTESCWIWNRHLNKKGYGRFSVRENGKTKFYKAHRYSWILSHGQIPDGMLVCHKCDTPSCVNPNHLFLGTNQDNTNDMIRKGREKYGFVIGMKKMECENSGNSKLTPIQIAEIRSKYNKKTCNSRHLSLIYNVHQRTISKILSGQRWKDLAPAK